MACKYDHEYKVQAVKLAKEIGGAKAAKELGIPEVSRWSINSQRENCIPGYGVDWPKPSAKAKTERNYKGRP